VRWKQLNVIWPPKPRPVLRVNYGQRVADGVAVVYVVEWILTEDGKVCQFAGFDGSKISRQSEGLSTMNPIMLPNPNWLWNPIRHREAG